MSVLLLTRIKRQLMKTKILGGILRNLKSLINRYISGSKFSQIKQGKNLYAKWSQEFLPGEEEMFLLRHFLKPNYIVFDIGANIGEFAYFLSTIIKKGEIYAFEPQKKVFRILKGTLNKVRNSYLYNLGLSSSTGVADIFIPIKEKSLVLCEASLEPNFDPHINPHSNDFIQNERIRKRDRYVKVKIRLTTLDLFCQRNKINQIDFIKCDAEGHELEVLKGAKKCLTTLRPILLVEIFPYIYDGHFENVCQYLEGLNYVGYVISEDKKNVCRLNEESQKNSAGCNYFFVPEEKEIEFLNCFQGNLQ
jgi:FkbM family methyltransferase